MTPNNKGTRIEYFEGQMNNFTSRNYLVFNRLFVCEKMVTKSPDTPYKENRKEFRDWIDMLQYIYWVK
jgi:hypothetical protein